MHEKSYAMKLMCAFTDIGLTLAGFRALKPTMTRVSVADTCAIRIPRATRSTATDSSGLFERAAIWTYDNRRIDALRSE